MPCLWHYGNGWANHMVSQSTIVPVPTILFRITDRITEISTDILHMGNNIRPVIRLQLIDQDHLITGSKTMWSDKGTPDICNLSGS
jgi:hypothetical protein